MEWKCILVGIFIGLLMGIAIMCYKTRGSIKNQKVLCKKLENNKIKLDEYQKELSNHFTCSIELLNKMAENYKELYYNVTKSANYFLPNIHIQTELHTSLYHEDTENDFLKKTTPIEAPRDYSDHIKKDIKNHS